eukprot:SAG31_NODE_1814_length_7210_cov_12.878920_2_plen_87_part_00
MNWLAVEAYDTSFRVCGCYSMNDVHCGESCPGPAINRLISVGPTATRRPCWDAPYFEDRSQSKCDQTCINSASQHGFLRLFISASA